MYSLSSGSCDRATSSTTEVKKPVVFIVDDDFSVRESLELLIKSAGWEPLLFESAPQFLSFPRGCGPSCLILDVNMPGLNGLDLQKKMVTDNSWSKLPIIFITGFGDVPMTVRAMKAGAVEFLMKPIDTGALLESVQAALQFSEAALREEIGMTALQQAYGSLSRRECEVMVLVVRGLLNKQVAFELGISEITVKAHRGQVMRKMDARSLPDLVNMAARLRLPAADEVH